MQTSMAVTALFMGLRAAPLRGHVRCCLRGHQPGRWRAQHPALLSFQFSRMLGYALFGAFAAGSVQGLAWLGTNTAVVAPGLDHVACGRTAAGLC
jgi:uncharacterized protein